MIVARVPRGSLTTEEMDQFCAHVQSQLIGRLYDFSLRLESNGLALEGRSHPYYSKQLAQQAVVRATALSLSLGNVGWGEETDRP